jgi:hypothetical protein
VSTLFPHTPHPLKWNICGDILIETLFQNENLYNNHKDYIQKKKKNGFNVDCSVHLERCLEIWRMMCWWEYWGNVHCGGFKLMRILVKVPEKAVLCLKVRTSYPEKMSVQQFFGETVHQTAGETPICTLHQRGLKMWDVILVCW